jgi:hypothetical protein
MLICCVHVSLRARCLNILVHWIYEMDAAADIYVYPTFAAATCLHDIHLFDNFESSWGGKDAELRRRCCC